MKFYIKLSIITKTVQVSLQHDVKFNIFDRVVIPEPQKGVETYTEHPGGIT